MRNPFSVKLLALAVAAAQPVFAGEGDYSERLEEITIIGSNSLTRRVCYGKITRSKCTTDSISVRIINVQ